MRLRGVSRGKCFLTTPRSAFCPFYEALGTAWERRTLVRHVFSFSGNSLRAPWERRTLVRHVIYLLSVSSVPSVRTLFFDLWNERKLGYRAVAKRRGAYAAMPKWVIAG